MYTIEISQMATLTMKDAVKIRILVEAQNDRASIVQNDLNWCNTY